MLVKVRYLGVLRSKLGLKEGEYSLEDGASLSDLFDKIVEVHGGSVRRLFEVDRSGIDPSFVITVNGVTVDRQHGKNIQLKNGDVVAIMSLISGG
jgi:MoaD family protein